MIPTGLLQPVEARQICHLLPLHTRREHHIGRPQALADTATGIVDHSFHRRFETAGAEHGPALMALPPDHRSHLEMPCKKCRYRRHTLFTPRQAALADVVQIPRDRTAIYMLGKDRKSVV